VSLLQGWSRKSRRLHRAGWPSTCSLQRTPRAQWLTRKPSSQEALGSLTAREPRNGGLAASIPCLPSPQKSATCAWFLGGSHQNWHISSVFQCWCIKFCYARQACQKISDQLYCEHWALETTSFSPVSLSSEQTEKPGEQTHPPRQQLSHCIHHWLLQMWAVEGWSTWEAVTVSEGWTPGQGVQRSDVAHQPLLYACSSR